MSRLFHQRQRILTISLKCRDKTMQPISKADRYTCRNVFRLQSKSCFNVILDFLAGLSRAISMEQLKKHRALFERREHKSPSTIRA